MGSQLDFFAALEETNLLKTSISKSRILLIRCDLWRKLLKAENSPVSVSLPLPSRGTPGPRAFVSICCLVIHVHATKVKENCLMEEKDGDEGAQTCEVPQLQLHSQSSVWHLTPFILLFLIHFIPITWLLSFPSFAPSMEQRLLRGKAISKWIWPPGESTTQANYPKPRGWWLPGKLEKKLLKLKREKKISSSNLC